MGRKRKDGDPFGLAGTRLAYRRGKFWYRHRGTDRFEDVGADLARAKKRAAQLNDPSGVYGTVRYWAPLYLSACLARVKAKLLAQRTYDDYAEDLQQAEGDDDSDSDSPLIIFFGAMPPEDIKPAHVQLYLEKGAEDGRPKSANGERATLSAMLSWILRQEDCPAGLAVNPCMQRSGVQRNPETKRERYVEHDEMREVFDVAPKSVRRMMALTYRTLQRPESDIVKWTSAIVHQVDDEHLELRFRQNKTKQLMRIAIAGELVDLIPKPPKGAAAKLGEPLVQRLDGNAYTYDGISSLLKDAIAVANERRKARGKVPMPSFGFRDLKGKGATDMWLEGVPLEQIQQLCGHANKTTTETYVKARWRETAQPNRVKLGA